MLRIARAAAVFTTLLLLCRVASGVFTAPPYDTPPRGWDSYDSNPIWRDASITEAEVLRQAEALAAYRDATGRASFPYVIIDEGWAESAEYGWLVDAYGRPAVNPALFPSSLSSDGFTVLAQYLRHIGLELGLWILKGIPAIAVEMNLPVLGTPYTARDIYIPKTCLWHDDVFWVNVSHPGGQAYYDSLAALFQRWGVTYVKMDCVFGGDLDAPEIEAAALSFASVTPQILLSISPGTFATPQMALSDAVGRVTAYRITNDVWDCFSYLDSTGPACVGGNSIINTTQQLVDFARHGLLAKKFSATAPLHIGASFPDPDMLAFGYLRLGRNHTTQFTEGNQRYIFGLWTITQSPIVLGGDVTAYPAATRALLNSTMLWAAHQEAQAPILLSANMGSLTDPTATGFTTWQSNYTSIVGGFFVGVFPFANDIARWTVPCDMTVPIQWPATPLIFPAFDVFNAFTGTQMTWLLHGEPFNVSVPYNDGAVYLFLPRNI